MYLFSASQGGFFLPGVHFDIPDDAVAVSEDEHRELMDGQFSGKLICADDQGRPMLRKRDKLPIEVRRGRAIDWIDATADRVRAADRSVGQYLDAEYQIVADALVVYRNDPEGEVPDAIQSYAAAEGLTAEVAAEQIAEAAARAVELLQAVRRIRLAGKAAVRDAADDTDMLEVARPYIDQLEALAKPTEPDAL